MEKKTNEYFRDWKNGEGVTTNINQNNVFLVTKYFSKLFLKWLASLWHHQIISLLKSGFIIVLKMTIFNKATDIKNEQK